MAKSNPPADDLPPDGNWRATLRAVSARFEPKLRPALTWVAAHRVHAAIGLMVGVVFVSTVAVLWLAEPSEEHHVDALIAQGLRALEREDMRQAVEYAAKIKRLPELASTHRYAPEYIYGVAASSRADDLTGRDKRRWRTLAAKHLDAAMDHGVPDALRAPVVDLLGKNLLESGQAAAALPWLKESLERQNPPSSATRKMLARAYAAITPPDWKAALAQWNLYLDDSTLTTRQRDEAYLDRADIEMRLGEYATARLSLQQIPIDSPVVAQQYLQLGRVLMHEAAADPKSPVRDDLYRQAIERLLDSQRFDTLDNRTTPRALYLTGLCEAALGRRDQALEAFDQVYKRFADSEEGLAAAIERGDMLLTMDRDDEAVATFRVALMLLPPAEAYQNAWLSRNELSDRVLLAYRRLLDGHRYSAAVAMAGLLSPLVGEARATQLLAETYERWADRLAAEAARPDIDDAPALAERARAAHRQAGTLYLRLARLRATTREYPDDLWMSVTSYLDGHDYASAIVQLREYLSIDTREHQREAQLKLGRSLLAAGETDAGLATLTQLIDEKSDDIAAFQARLVASRTLLEQGKSDQARALLLSNLENDVLTPASREWQASLLALAELLHAGGDYSQAIARLEEYTVRYPAAVETPLARYLLADSYAASAAQSIARAASAKLSSVRDLHQQQAHEKYQQALASYDVVLADASDRAPSDAILRNSYFGRAATLAALGRYDDAREAYLAIILRYQQRPEVLPAYVELAGCYRRMNRPLEARQALAQATAVLARLPAGVDFAATTNCTRDQWRQVLESMNTL